MLEWSEQGASWRKVGQRSKSKLWDTSQHLAVRAVANVGCCKDVIWLRFWKDPVAALRVEAGRSSEALAINQIRLERGQCSGSGCSLKVEPTEFASILLEEKERIRGWQERFVSSGNPRIHIRTIHVTFENLWIRQNHVTYNISLQMSWELNSQLEL